MNVFKHFLYLQRNDREALIAVLAVMLLSVTALIVIGEKEDSPSSAQSQSKAKASADSIMRFATKEHPAYANDGTDVHEVFAFDPNTASAEDFKRLGLSSWQINGILKYRSKGGVYREPNDFARVYDMTKKQFESLLPFIRIGEEYQLASKFYSRERNYGARGGSVNASSSSSEAGKTGDAPIYSYPHKIKAGEQIAVNAADTAELMKIPGIGSYYAKNIIRYRDRLGGFVSARQVLEVEGVPETIVAYLSVDASQVRKLDINKFSVSQLRQHPYLTFYQAKEIFDYRRRKGPIKDIGELRLLKEFPPAAIERLRPYLAYE